MFYIYLFLNYIFRFFKKTERYVNLKLATRGGLKIGAQTLLVGTQSFGTEPFLISIGEKCLITDGVKFITHDGSIQVPLIKNGEFFHDVYSKKSIFNTIFIGDNVFIGIGSIVLPGTIVSNNTIIAAGSIVKGEFPANVVIGGNPARIICTVEEYYLKNKKYILEFKDGMGRVEFIKSKVL